MVDGATCNMTFSDLMVPQSTLPTQHSLITDPFDLLPSLLFQGSKIMLDHDGSYQKGFLMHYKNANICFVIKRILCSAKVNCTILLPDFYLHWPTLIGDNTLLLGHITVSLVL